jgi:hypothetical protein
MAVAASRDLNNLSAVAGKAPGVVVCREIADNDCGLVNALDFAESRFEQRGLARAGR